MTPLPLIPPPSPVAEDLLWAVLAWGLHIAEHRWEVSPSLGPRAPLMAPFCAGKVASHRAGPLQFWWSPLYSKHLCKEVSTWQGSVYSTGAFCRTSVGWVSARWASGRNSGERRRETRDQNERGCHAAYLCKPEWRLTRDSFHTPLSELVTYDWGWAMLQEGESRLLRRALSTSSF